MSDDDQNLNDGGDVIPAEPGFKDTKDSGPSLSGMTNDEPQDEPVVPVAEEVAPEPEEPTTQAESEPETESTPAEAADEEMESADDVISNEGEKSVESKTDSSLNAQNDSPEEQDESTEGAQDEPPVDNIHSDDPNVKWYVVHTYSGHENKVATALKQRVEAEHLEHKIMDVLVPTQEKIEIRGGKKTPVKEKIFPGYILVKMILDDNSWLAVRTTQGVTAFIGIGNKPTPIPEAEVRTIVRFMTQGAAPTFKDVFLVDDPVKIIDGPFSEFIGKVDTVDKEHGKVRVLVSIFGRETPVELDFLQVQKL